MEELTLIFERERVRFDGSDVAILECRQEVSEDDINDLLGDIKTITVKAECEQHELMPGLSYRFYGHWQQHHKYGQQFHARTFVRTQPHSRAGIVRYLMQAPNVGQVTALALWNKFGSDAVRILRESPDVASTAAGKGFNEERAKEAAGYLWQEKRTEDTYIDLIDLLGGRGFPKDLPKKLIKEWQSRAAELANKNPYLLMKFRRCGFLRCDQLYLDLGGRPERIKRQALCAWYTLARDKAGHTWYSPDFIERGLRERIAGSKVEPVKAIILARRAGMLATHRNGSGDPWIAEAAKARAEGIVAERASDWLHEVPCWPSLAELDVSDHQRQVLDDALTAPLSLFTGGPGTGKTYSAARVIGQLLAQHGYGQVAVAAPTGKAAVRITEAMQGYGINLRAKTIHSTLGVESHSEGEGWGFRHGPDLPLPYKFIVVDESSMIDTSLAASLFSACGHGTHMLLVGDTAQLPPVGHGAPLRDFIAAGVPNGELTEIKRNSGAIVTACHEIRRGRTFQVCDELDPDSGQNLRLLPASTPRQAMDYIIKSLRTIASHGIADPVRECQVIVAVNKKSELSRKSINHWLQSELNPDGERALSNPFRVSDKIVCTKNSFFPAILDCPPGFNQEQQDGKVFVANGEQAMVKFVQPNMTIAQLEAPARLIKIPRGTGPTTDDDEEDEDAAANGCQWDLAYGISCHKAQGSEWPIVFVVLDEYPAARMVTSREWLYTAISRAKTACFLVGKLDTAYAMIQRQAIQKRKTFLKEQILHGSDNGSAQG